MNTSKIKLHVKQFSLKTHWRLAKDSYATKAVKKEKIQMELSRKGRSNRVGTCVPRGDTEEKRKITDLKIIPGD